MIVFFFDFIGSSSDCKIEARLSDTFRIKKADFDEMIIVRKIRLFF
jgi:hypothetical protein